MITPPPHTPMTLNTGPIRCVERDCPEYLTADGYDDLTIERCSHLTTTTVCGLCSIESDHGFYDETTPWPCPEAGQRPRPRPTEAEHDAAWHAIEGIDWGASPDPDTVLNAVLAALGIDPPEVDEMAASLRRDGFGDDEIASTYRPSA